MQHRKYPKLLLISILSLSIVLAYSWAPAPSQASTAFAHAFVIGSDPIDGSTIKVAPAVVRIFFNAAIGPASTAHIFTPDGRLVEAKKSSISSTNPRELDTPLITSSSLPQGGYTVRWTALSNDDGHITHGVIGFNLGQSSTGLPGETILGPTTSNILPQLDLFGGLSVAWDWLVLVALTFWIGILLMEGLILTRFGGQPTTLLLRARKRSVPLQWLCLAALLVGEIITLVLRMTLLTQTVGNSGIDALRQLIIETNYGYLWLLRIALIILALLFLWSLSRRDGRRGVGARFIAPACEAPIYSLAPLPNLERRHSWPPSGRSPFARLRRQVAQEHGIRFPLPHDAETTSRRGVSLPAPLDAPSRSPTVEGAPSPSPTDATAVRTPPYWHTIVWLTLAGLIVLTIVLTSDTAQLAQPHISAIVLSWLYLVAQSLWFGIVAYLGYVLLPLLPLTDPDHHAGRLALLLRHLTTTLVCTLGVLLVSGLFLTETSLSTAQQLITDAYGRTVLVKIILIACMLLLTLYTLFIIRPKLARQALLLHVVDTELPARRVRQSAMGRTEQQSQQSLRSLSWLGAGVLLCTALMTFYAPPIVFPAINYTPNTSPVTSISNTQTQQIGDLTVTLLLTPGRFDYSNMIVVTLNDSRGKPINDAQVQLSTNMELMDMGTAHTTIASSNPTYIATFAKGRAFSMPGLWDITVRIQRPNAAPVQALFKVTVAG